MQSSRLPGVPTMSGAAIHVERDVSQMSGPAGGSLQQTSVDDHAAAHAGAQREHDGMPSHRAPRRSRPLARCGGMCRR